MSSIAFQAIRTRQRTDCPCRSDLRSRRHRRRRRHAHPLLTNGRYGFHRDELQFLSDARHLDWGFVAYPPFTPFVEHIVLALFGLSLVGLRLFSVLAQATAIVVTGLMARELGGRRLAQVTAALAVALSPAAAV